MDQKRIMELLQEAAQIKNPIDNRFNEIGAELGSQVAHRRKDRHEGIVHGLFFDAVQNNRQRLLPSLFPVFALLCGDRDETKSVVAPVDWSLMDEISKS